MQPEFISVTSMPALLHEAAVNADLAEFVFNQNDLLAGKRLFKQFLDQRRLARAKKAGKISIFVMVSISLWVYI